MSVQNDVMVEHSSVESVNSAHTQSGLSGSSSLTVNPEATPPSRLESTSMQQNQSELETLRSKLTAERHEREMEQNDHGVMIR